MQLFDDLPTPAVHLDSEGRIKNANSHAKTLFGWQHVPSDSPPFIHYIAREEVSKFNNFYSQISKDQPLSVNATLCVDKDCSVAVTIKAARTTTGDSLFLLNRHDTYASGCGEKCFYAAILEAQYQQNPGGILLVNRKHEMISFNKEFVRMWDIPVELQESRDEEASLQYALEKTADPDSFIVKVQAIYENPEQVATDEVYLKDGRVFYRHTYPIYSAGNYLGRAWYFLDVTPLKKAHYQISKQQIVQNAILEHIQDGVIACDGDARLILYNRATRQLFGMAETEPMPELLADLNCYLKENNQPTSPAKGPMTRALAGDKVKNEEIVVTSEEGRKHTVRVNGQAMHDSLGNKLGAVISLHDITDLNEVKRQLSFMAYHDALTTLPNRRLFHDLLEQSLKHAHRNQQQVGVLFLDLDNFKSINDLHGHDMGDQLLILIAETLRSCLRDSDILCRWGGDEFVIGLLESDNGSNVKAVAEKICSNVLASIEKKDRTFNVSVSIGIAIYPNHGTEPDLLIRNADMAMYRAKRLGKNRSELFLPSLPD